MNPLRHLLALLLAAAALCVTGCASLGSSGTESMLSASGFRTRTPQTADQKEIYAKLPPYKLERGNYKGKIFYVYKDEKQGIAYVGGEEEYQKYQQLAIQRQLARTQYEAAMMNRSLSYGWYGAYPYSYYGRW
jgi:hypothetical protein